MKTLRMSGLAFIAILLTGSFTSCSKDGDSVKENGEILISEKKLTKIVTQSDAYYSIHTFQYDGNGRLLKDSFESKRDNATDFSSSSLLIWKDNTIDIDLKQSSWPYQFLLTLDNGRVQTEEEMGFYNISYIYNPSNRLSEIIYVTDFNSYVESFQWEGDKIISISGEDYNTSFAYKQTCEKGYFPLFTDFCGWSDHSLFEAHPELVGIHTKQLPSSITNDYSDGYNETFTFSYEFDAEGYIAKIIMKTGNKIETYTLTWE